MNTMMAEMSHIMTWIKGWSFQDKTILPLQAADTIAYEYYRIVDKALVKKQPLGFRRSARDLIRKEEAIFFREWDKKAFLLWMNNWKEEN
jgi:hypothetical protein